VCVSLQSGREEMKWLREKIDKLEQKIQQDEERLLNEQDPRKCDTLQKFIDRNTATLRGYVQQLAQIQSTQPPPRQCKF
jgi:DNA-binding PadR family transcriptional regulator